MSQANQPQSSVSSAAQNSVASPCIDICELNDDNICMGCYRSIDEIVAWRSLSKAEQLAVNEAAAKRKKASE